MLPGAYLGVKRVVEQVEVTGAIVSKLFSFVSDCRVKQAKVIVPVNIPKDIQPYIYPTMFLDWVP